MRFGKTRVERGDGFMMVIEEPELHVPPPLQRKLLRLLQSMTTQTIVTTHSPTVAAIPDAHQIGLVVNSDGNLSVRPLLEKPLDPNANNPIRRLLLAERDTTILALMNPHVLIPEGKTDASWFRLLVKCLELRPSEARDPGLAFAHEVGVIPTPDARIADVYGHMNSIHPSALCLVDGDAAGTIYSTALCQLQPPPRTIVRWPNNWAIENVIGWIVAAHPAVLHAPELIAAGVPQTADQLVTALLGGLKKDEVVHSLIADAIAGSEACLGRTAHVLRLVTDLASGRDISAGAATGVLQANATTTVWTFNNAVQGI
jgi:hypothetical protein